MAHGLAEPWVVVGAGTILSWYAPYDRWGKGTRLGTAAPAIYMRTRYEKEELTSSKQHWNG